MAATGNVWISGRLFCPQRGVGADGSCTGPRCSVLSPALLTRLFPGSVSVSASTLARAPNHFFAAAESAVAEPRLEGAAESTSSLESKDGQHAEQEQDLRRLHPTQATTPVSAADLESEEQHVADESAQWDLEQEAAEQQEVSEKEVDPHRVYVGGIPFDFQGTELRDALHKLFCQFGPVKEVEIAAFANDPQITGRHRGFGFVVMEIPEDARAAIACLNGQFYWGRNLMVRHAFRKVETKPEPAHPCQLYVGNINKTLSNRELHKVFKRYGEVLQTKIIKEYITGESRGFGFVTFAEEKAAKRAAQALNGHALAGFTLKVNIAEEPRYG